MEKWDHMIVGQGLAGTLLGYFLEQMGRRVLFVDAAHHLAASKVAAGIMNPVTGRRYVKSWMVDSLFPFAQDTFRQMGQEMDSTYFHPHTIIRSLFSTTDENEWMMRSGLPDYEPYVAPSTHWGQYAKAIEKPYSAFSLLQGGRVDIASLIQDYQKKWSASGQLLCEFFDFDALELHGDVVCYQGRYTSPSLIFCEGFQAMHNPYFSYLRHWPTKGEVLMVRIPGAGFQQLLKHRLFVVPFGEDLYWVGGTNEAGRADSEPTLEKRTYLEERLASFLKLPYQIEAQLAAVRPTVRDRRPYLGRHPQHSALSIFNGLGAKGASLGPYWAKEMAQHLVKNTPLPRIVDIAREWQH